MSDKCTNRLESEYEDGLDNDGNPPPPCGDEGELCAECSAKELAYWSGYFGRATGENLRLLAGVRLTEEQEVERFNDLKDAGR